MTLSEHRARARQYLGGHIFSGRWMYVLLAGLIIGAISTAIGAFPGVGAIATLLLSGAFAVGLALFLLPLARSADAQPELGKLFNGFTEGFVENMLLGLMTAIFTFLWSLLFIIPGIVKGFAYSMAPYIRADHPEYTWKQCLDESIRITRGHKMRLFLLQLSFIGWIIVGALAFGIGILWVDAYMSAATVSYYESIRDELPSEKVEESPTEEAPAAE